MSSPAKDKEPKIITNWRIAYKKRHGGIEAYRYLPKEKSFDFDWFKKRLNNFVSMNYIPKKSADLLLKRYEKRLENIGKIPKYESSGQYPFLKSLSNRIAAVIPDFLDNIDIDHINDYYRLKHTPVIITKLRYRSLFSTGTGWAYKSEEIPYIEFSLSIPAVITNLSMICSWIFDAQNVDDVKNLHNLKIVKLVESNIKRFPSIFQNLSWYCSNSFIYDLDAFLRGYDVKLEYGILSKYLLIRTDLEPPVDKLFCIADPMREAMGLFLMGHEYSHILLKHINDPIINESVIKRHEKEHRADELAFDLAWKAWKQEYQPFDKSLDPCYFYVSIEILFNVFHIIECLYGSVYISPNLVAISDSYPKAKIRIKRLRKYIKLKRDRRLSKYIDAVDYFFKSYSIRKPQ